MECFGRIDILDSLFDMKVEEFLSKYSFHGDQQVWAVVKSYAVDVEEAKIVVNVTLEDFDEVFRIECQGVKKFRLADTDFETVFWMEENSVEVAAYSSPVTTYVIWGDQIDWPKFIGRLMQEFGHIPNLVRPEYMQATKQYNDYQLPVTLPKSMDAQFRSLIEETRVEAYVRSESSGKAVRRALKFDQESFILALEIDVIEPAI